MIQAFIAKCVYCPKDKETQSVNLCDKCPFYKGKELAAEREIISCSWDSCQL